MRENEHVHGFAVHSCRVLPDLDARIFELEHEKSGARLVWLDREDDNKTFGIAFRTVPEDDTGVFHILEHSVLCGSDSYPVKEPFVELMKSSMQTFLNAITFPDKTCYPISSRNWKDFLNLMRVYMDAVLHPLIYSRPEIFEQEGWHYELSDGEGAPIYKGVVFNEMKGALSSPDAILENELGRRLFPDTCYRFVSGGDPVHIPDLTYEKFLDCHRRFYHPSNSYIFLDGQMDIEAVLAILDGEFLSAYDRQAWQPEIAVQPPVQSEPVQVQYELSPNEPTDGKARLAWGYVLGRENGRMERIAMQALADVICGSNEAPLKRRILSAGLAQDVRLEVTDGILQPYVKLEVRNLDAGRAEEVRTAIRDELSRLVREGLDHEHLAASLSNMEFKLRERDYGRMPQGLVFGLTILESWLYGGDPAAELEIGELFTSLNRKLDEGWFEELLERMLLKNPHNCEITLLPSHTLGEEKQAAESARLNAAQESWDPEKESILREQQEKLTAWQTAPDTPEALATVPKLQLSDIPDKPEDFPLEESTLAGIPLLRHRIAAGGIGYYNLYFDISDLTENELPSAAFLCALLSNLDTKRRNSLELQMLLSKNSGFLTFTVEPYSHVNQPDSCRIYLCVSFSAVESKISTAVELVTEILTETLIHDQQKLRELLRQNLTDMEQRAAYAGHVCAMTRVSAGLSADGLVRECTGGVTYCQWLKELEKNFDGQAEQIQAVLQSLYGRVFTTGRLTVSVTGAEDDTALERVLLAGLPASPRCEYRCGIKPWGRRREGIAIPTDIAFAALGGNLLECGCSYSGSLRVTGRIVSLAYLWNVIRVQGGAYGTGLSVNDTGIASFYSYRDPNGLRSLGCYRQAADFMEQFCAADPDITGFIIGAVSESEPYMMPRMRGKQSDVLYFKDVSYADRCRYRKEALETSIQQLPKNIRSLRELTANCGVCVIGSLKQLEACGAELDDIITL